MKVTMTSTRFVHLLAVVTFFGQAEFAQAQPLTNTGVLQDDILQLITAPPVCTSGGYIEGENDLFDFHGDPGFVQSAVWDIGGGLFLYGYQWECHTGPNWDILTLHVPMSGTTPVELDLNNDNALESSWAITEFVSDFMPYNQDEAGLLALCLSDDFDVDIDDFVTGAVYNPPGFGDEIVFSNDDGIFFTSNLFFFVTNTPPQLVETTGGGSQEDFGTEVDFTTAPFTICAPSEATAVDCSGFPCGNKGNKVLLCHVPPGNPENEHTLCINPNAVAAHLENHEGDHCGPCEGDGNGNG